MGTDVGAGKPAVGGRKGPAKTAALVGKHGENGWSDDNGRRVRRGSERLFATRA